MSPWLLAALVLLVCGAGPALLLTARGDPVDRLVGLELAGVVVSLLLVVLAHAWHQSSYLIVPVVLALLSVAGILVFTRLLRPRR